MSDIYRKAKAIMLHDSNLYICKSPVDISQQPFGMIDLCAPAWGRLSVQSTVNILGTVLDELPKTIREEFPDGLVIERGICVQPSGYRIVELHVSIPCSGMVHIRAFSLCDNEPPEAEPTIEESTHCGSFTVAWE